MRHAVGGTRRGSGRQREPAASTITTSYDATPLADATPVSDSRINEELVQLGHHNRELQLELERQLSKRPYSEYDF
jgi:hypothetical protein